MRVSTNQFQQTSTNSILDQQSKLLKTQQQLATGRKILTPSDDPAGAARVLDLEKSIGQVEQFNRNLDRAEFALKTEESVLEETGNIIQRVRELTVQSLNATQDGANRKIIAAEIRQLQDQLVQLANTQDGTGEFIFAGSNTRTRPFALGDGDVNYTGDQTQRLVQAGPSRQLATNHTGFETFMRIREGNGEFTTAAAPGNGGTAVIDGGRILDRTVAFDGPYTIAFTEQANGELTYTVSNAGGNLVEDAPYNRGDAIVFDGREVAISGTPVDGDSFEVAPAGFNSLFGMLDDLAAALEASGSNETSVDRSRFLNAGNSALGNLDQALDNILNIRSEVGARLNAVDGERRANESSLLDLREAKSNIEDVDYAKAISELNLRQVGLQAAQQSYVRIQGLSLFNFL
ncbi:flagellar hook-associated protein 3 FlgL [Natronocella acetinitrilica]|uniref:Flagellar hook-associated protein 3 FlgL n=1 Tax=Natronocella acetinitrilica TaxID=414046 RepID=A0AAE3G5W4_9GAMM|nr:flagellar hook-associated protein FlgL [Natronocella acetinitrilica]MCP1675614.1 flagellar hook-associated protein 3 FlgL [Natronocella acetinitrilica]